MSGGGGSCWAWANTWLLMTTMLAVCGAKPIKHFGRCNVSLLELGYCIPHEACTDELRVTDPAINSQCTSKIQLGLVCCRPKRTTNEVSATKLVLPQPGECGGDSLDDRIIQGQVADIRDFPWMALLRYSTNGEEFSHSCGGSLIHSRWVLTAAHCVPPEGSYTKLLEVRLGEWNTTSNPDCQQFTQSRICAPPHQDFRIDRTIVHEEYSPTGTSKSNHANDIALLRLAKTVTFTDYIQPICLLASNRNTNHNYAGYAMDIAGWGNTEHIHFGGSPIKRRTLLHAVAQDSCRSVYDQLNPGQLCAGGSTLASTCHGDSGGPLMLLRDNNKGSSSYYAAGIVSLGSKNCNNRGRPMIFTRVEYYASWLVATMSSNSS